jgi:hypothetical protein
MQLHSLMLPLSDKDAANELLLEAQHLDEHLRLVGAGIVH